MKKEKDSYWIRRHRDDKQFIDYIQSLINENKFDEALQKIKISEILLSYTFYDAPIEQQQAVNTVLQSMQLYREDSINKFKNELKVLSDLKNKTLNETKAMHKKFNKKNYGAFFVGYINSILYDEIMNTNATQLAEKLDITETLISTSSNILKYLLKMEVKFDINFNPKKRDHTFLEKLLQNGLEIRAVNNLIETWIYSELSISSLSIKKYIDIKENGDFSYNELLCKIPFLDLKTSKNLNRFMKYIDDYENPISTFAFFKEFLTDSVKEYFFTNNLSIKYAGLTLNKWIESYQVIYKECISLTNNFSRNTGIHYYLKEQLELLFINEGFENEEINTILDYLSFSQNSKDLFDSPLIKSKNGYLLVPYLIPQIDFSRSLVSTLNIKEERIAKKGTSFEKHIEKLSKEGVKKCYTNIKIRFNKEDYELDNVIILDNDIFILEVKTQKQPLGKADYYAHLEQTNNYLKKFKRNADYFSSKGIKHLYKYLHINNHKNIYKVFVSNVPQIKIKIDDIYLIDEINYYGFMKRITPTINEYSLENGVTVMPLLRPYYSGKITSDKFIAFLEDVEKIERNKARIKHKQILLENLRINVNLLAINDLSPIFD